MNGGVVAMAMSVVWRRKWRQCGGALAIRLVATKRKSRGTEEDE